MESSLGILRIETYLQFYIQIRLPNFIFYIIWAILRLLIYGTLYVYFKYILINVLYSAVLGCIFIY